jgi:hypothetical protein
MNISSVWKHKREELKFRVVKGMKRYNHSHRNRTTDSTQRHDTYHSKAAVATQFVKHEGGSGSGSGRSSVWEFALFTPCTIQQEIASYMYRKQLMWELALSQNCF